MRYLLYCIFHTPENQRPETLLGVENQPVVIISNNGLCAAASRLTQSELPLETSQIINYKKVIDAFHQDRTVIPIRYGCLVKRIQHVSRLLESRSNEYGLLLKDLEGCVEMGIRVMVADCGLRPGGAYAPEGLRIAGLKKREMKLETRNSKLKTSGKAYLAARKDHYAQEECITEAKNEIAEQFRAALTGLFVKCKVETPPMPNRQSSMLSLYFLVPGKSIDPFRQVFRNMRRQMETTKILLSGPWPPYNFVMADHFSKQETSFAAQK